MQLNARLDNALNSNDLPQSQRALRKPTDAQLQTVLPGPARRVLEDSAQITLLSIDSWSGSPRAFHGYRILGQTTLSSAAKRALVASFYDGLIAPNGQREASYHSCYFEPRHGLRATRNGVTLDLLICFKCHQLRVDFDGQESTHNFSINGAPQAEFNQILTAAQVPLAR